MKIKGKFARPEMVPSFQGDFITGSILIKSSRIAA
jgi:hypothetical protein